MAERDVIETKGRRARDRSAVLLFVGVVLLVPPLAGIALIDDLAFGIPIPLLYVFSVWAGLIIAGALLARPLRAFDQPANIADESTPEGTDKREGSA